MRVHIKLLNDSLQVTELSSGGSADGEPTVVKPGETWKGWKYRRLKRKGDGEHNLVTRESRQAMTTSAVTLGESEVLTLRGWK